jgi:hypothetical protein
MINKEMFPRCTIYEDANNIERDLTPREQLIKNILYLCQMATSKKTDKDGYRIDPEGALISINIPFECTPQLDTSVTFVKTISRLIEYKTAEKISSFNLNEKSDENKFAFTLLTYLTSSIENEVEQLEFLDLSRLTEALQEQPTTLFRFPSISNL